VPSDYNNDEFIPVDSLRSIREKKMSNFFDRIRQTPARTIYLSVDFSHVDNPGYNVPSLYSIKNATNNYGITEIDHISMMMPPVVALYDWHMLPKVSLCTNLKK
jgi:hypothetical protein